MREIPYDLEAICDCCGHKGAFDFMGDFICEECLKICLPEEEDNDYYDEEE